MNRPTTEDMKAIQAKAGRPGYHFAYFDKDGFVMAHTDEERATIPLDTCGLHCAIRDADEMPVRAPGYYMYLPAWEKWVKLP